MASGNSQIQRSSLGPSVEVNRENDSRKGLEFEDEVILRSILTLVENQCLAREVVSADKFDDVVLVNNVDNGKPVEYYLHQLKHKQDSTKSIAWDDLLLGTNGQFSLEKYFDWYLKIMKNSGYANQIKALVIVTNVGLGASRSFQQQQQNATNPTNLNLISKQEANLQGNKGNTKQPNYPITNDDLNFYFQNQPMVGTARNWCNIAMGKRFQFNSQGICDVTNLIFATSATTRKHKPADFQKFLCLLVFEVETPAQLENLRGINKAIFKIFFPFHWDAACQDKWFILINKKLLGLFKSVLQGTTYIANWATVEKRRELFEQLIKEFKEEVSLGSTKSYEVKALTAFSDKLNFGLIDSNHLTRISPWSDVFTARLMKSNGGITPSENGPFSIVNVFSQESNAMVITLKLFKKIQDLSMESKTLIIQINDEEGIKNVTEHFENLSTDVMPHKKAARERFWFVITVSPLFSTFKETDRKVKELTQSLITLKELRNWIQFVIVTQRPIDQDYHSDFQSIQDTPLKWCDLPEPTKSYLYEKTLFLEGNKKTILEALQLNQEASELKHETTEDYWETSLKALGLNKGTIGSWMKPISLAEVIIRDKIRPLYLGLPQYDPDLDTICITRRIKFPVVKLGRMSEKLKEKLFMMKTIMKRKFATIKRVPTFCYQRYSHHHWTTPLSFGQNLVT